MNGLTNKERNFSYFILFLINNVNSLTHVKHKKVGGNNHTVKYPLR